MGGRLVYEICETYFLSFGCVTEIRTSRIEVFITCVRSLRKGFSWGLDGVLLFGRSEMKIDRPEVYVFLLTRISVESCIKMVFWIILRILSNCICPFLYSLVSRSCDLKIMICKFRLRQEKYHNKLYIRSLRAGPAIYRIWPNLNDVSNGIALMSYLCHKKTIQRTIPSWWGLRSFMHSFMVHLTMRPTAASGNYRKPPKATESYRYVKNMPTWRRRDHGLYNLYRSIRYIAQCDFGNRSLWLWECAYVYIVC